MYMYHEIEEVFIYVNCELLEYFYSKQQPFLCYSDCVLVNSLNPEGVVLKTVASRIVE